MSKFMENLASLLATRGISEIWLYKKTGIKRSTLNGWKNKGRNPPVDAAFRMAKALGTTIEELLGESYDGGPRFNDRSLDAACDFFLELSEAERYEALAAAMRAVRRDEKRAKA